MDKELSLYFSEVEDPRVEGRCMHLLSDILMISLLTYLTGGTDYQDMYIFAKERGVEFKGLLQLPNGFPSVDTFEFFFKIRKLIFQYFKTLFCISRGAGGKLLFQHRVIHDQKGVNVKFILLYLTDILIDCAFIKTQFTGNTAVGKTALMQL